MQNKDAVAVLLTGFYKILPAIFCFFFNRILQSMQAKVTTRVLSDIIGSLSTDVRRPRTATGSWLFFLLDCFCYLSWTGKFLFWYLVTCHYRCDGVKARQKKKDQLPVAVRGSRTSVLKLPNIARYYARADWLNALDHSSMKPKKVQSVNFSYIK